MEQTKHCVLCKNSLSRFKDGLYCGITNEKPDFNNSCSEIKLGNNFFNELKSVHIEFEKIKRTKITNYLHFFTFLLISLIIFLMIYLFRDYFFSETKNMGTVLSFGIPIIVFAIGVYVASIAFGNFNKYKNDLAIATDRKNHIDSIINIYNIQYDINLEFGKKYLGVQEITVDLKFKNHILINENEKKNHSTSHYHRSIEL